MFIRLGKQRYDYRVLNIVFPRASCIAASGCYTSRKKSISYNETTINMVLLAKRTELYGIVIICLFFIVRESDADSKYNTFFR